MSKFQAGDRVRVMSVDNGPLQRDYLGKVGSIHKQDELGYEVRFDDSHIVFFFNHRLQRANEDESLETLLRKANEGFKAVDELRKLRPTNVEVRSDKYPGWDLIREWVGANNVEYRLKPEPKFEPFATSNGWDVKLDGDRLHIGCQSFSAKTMLSALTALLNENRASFYGLGDVLFVIRGGNKFGEHVLPWADADEILEALTKAGV